MRILPWHANGNYQFIKTFTLNEYLPDIMGTYHMLRNIFHFQQFIVSVWNYNVEWVFNQAVKYSHRRHAQKQHTCQKLFVSYRHWTYSRYFHFNLLTFGKNIMLLIFMLWRVHTIHLQSLLYCIFLPWSQTVIIFIPLSLK